MPQDTKAVIRRLYDIINWGDLDRLSEVISPDCVYQLVDGSEYHGPEGYREAALTWRNAVPDLYISITHMVAEGDRVAYRYTITGTHLGEWAGIPPTGNTLTDETMAIDRVVDGKIVESSEISDALGVLEQLGLVEKDIVP